LAKQGVRDQKAERWTRNFVVFDRNVRESYQQMPSPLTTTWENYIRYRLTIMKRAIQTFTTEKYTRLHFDKYVESNRVCDLIAAMLVSNCESFWFCSQLSTANAIN
jgi:hypothetical protein